MFGKAFGGRTKKRKTLVKESYETLIADESDKLLDEEQLVNEAIHSVENNGIVFLDEIDKIAVRDGGVGGSVSREGVQRDLLPLIEGTIVSTKHGQVKTDHILFVASGAFHVSKPSDLLPELQGRLPIRVELRALEKEDFKRILVEPEASLIKQYTALMGTEEVTLEFDDEAIDAIAGIAVDLNAAVENIGARRLQTVMERLLDDISFKAPARKKSKSMQNMSRNILENFPEMSTSAAISCDGPATPSAMLDKISGFRQFSADVLQSACPVCCPEFHNCTGLCNYPRAAGKPER